MNGESEELKPQVKGYAGPVILVSLMILAGLGIGLIWGLDPRWLYSAAVAFAVVLILCAADQDRREAKAVQAVRKARYEAAREAMDGPFDQAVFDFSWDSRAPGWRSHGSGGPQ